MSKTEIISSESQKITVKVIATDSENDIISYKYEVTGGKIIGQGADVIWDLSDVKPAIYKITVCADDGIGCDSKYIANKEMRKEDLQNKQTREVQVIKLPKSIEDFPNGTINSLDLDKNAIVEKCICENSGSATPYQVKVSTNAVGTEEELIYKYEVTGGRIIGQGANVIWDLSNVKLGDYIITVSVDDGCGFCSEPKNEVVRVIKCRDCD